MQKYSPDAILATLHAAALKAEQDSDEIAQKFLYPEKPDLLSGTFSTSLFTPYSVFYVLYTLHTHYFSNSPILIRYLTSSHRLVKI